MVGDCPHVRGYKSGLISQSGSLSSALYSSGRMDLLEYVQYTMKSSLLSLQSARLTVHSIDDPSLVPSLSNVSGLGSVGTLNVRMNLTSALLIG